MFVRDRHGKALAVARAGGPSGRLHRSLSGVSDGTRVTGVLSRNLVRWRHSCVPERGRVVVEPDGRMIALPDVPGVFAGFEAALRRLREVEGSGAADGPRSWAAAC